MKLEVGCQFRHCPAPPVMSERTGTTFFIVLVQIFHDTCLLDDASPGNTCFPDTWRPWANILTYPGIWSARGCEFVDCGVLEFVLGSFETSVTTHKTARQHYMTTMDILTLWSRVRIPVTSRLTISLSLCGDPSGSHGQIRPKLI
jgi:hypothetical protein